MFNGREISDYLNDIKSALAEIEEFTSGMDFDAVSTDRKTVNAVIRSLEVFGEATKHIFRQILEENIQISPGVRWRECVMS